MSDANDRSSLTPPRERDPASWSTLYVGALGVLLVALTVIGVEVLYYKTTAREFIRKDVEQGTAEVQAIIEGQRRLLDEYHWVDRDAGVVGIPIEVAIDRVAVAESPGEARAAE